MHSPEITRNIVRDITSTLRNKYLVCIIGNMKTLESMGLLHVVLTTTTTPVKKNILDPPRGNSEKKPIDYRTYIQIHHSYICNIQRWNSFNSFISDKKLHNCYVLYRWSYWYRLIFFTSRRRDYHGCFQFASLAYHNINKHVLVGVPGEFRICTEKQHPYGDT